MSKKYKHKYQFINILTTLILIINSNFVFSQIFDGGQNPPSTKFKQINTPNFQIIFPTLLEKEAQKTANTLEKIVIETSKSLGIKPHPISIIFQSNLVEANGFVQSAPRRSEYYTISPQETDNQDWINGLALHELRHVVQFDKIGKSLNSPFFEQLKLVIFGISLPSWFFEGDAVLIETLLSDAGRGRQPSFDIAFRSNQISNKKYTYSKNYLGSFKDITPDYYTLGYYLTAKLRKEGGVSVLDQTLERVARLPFRPYNFSNSIKKTVGFNTKKLYYKTTKEVDSLWENQLTKIHHKNYISLNKTSTKNPSNYYFPKAINNDNIIALKRSKSNTNQIVSINKKEEKVLKNIGNQTEPNLNYANNNIVWTEYKADKRYGKRSFNVIYLHNLETKKTNKIATKGKYYSPTISPNGEKISVIKINLNNNSSLYEIDIKTGKEVKLFDCEGEFALQTPQYNQLGNKIIITGANQNGKTFLLYDLEKKLITKLFNEVKNTLARPIFWNEQIIYQSDEDGIDNLFLLDLNTQEKYKITHSKFGAFNASINIANNTLYFNDYQYTGYNAVSINLDSLNLISTSKLSNNTIEYFKSLESQEISSNVFENIPNIKYEVKPYKEINHLFYVHSINPIANYLDDDSDYRLGLSFVSENKLNTMSASAGYSYNQSLKSNEFYAGLSYKKFYPIFSINFADIEKQFYASQNINNQISIIPFTARETSTKFKINVPFFSNWHNKTMSSGFNILSSYTHRYQNSLNIKGFTYNVKFPMEYQVYWGLNTLKSQRDLLPKWGANLTAKYLHLPFHKDNVGEMLIFNTSFLFPGLLSNHSIQANFNWQSGNGIFNYSNDITRARGYQNLKQFENLRNTFLTSYRFPIAYPDLEIGSIAYIKRLRGTFFADFENINYNGGIRTYGAGIAADFNAFRYYLPLFEISTRMIIPAKNQVSLNNNKNPFFEFGLSYSY